MTIRETYKELELEPGCGAEDVKRAFRELAQIHHPDRFATASESIRARAEHKMKRLNEAYSVVMERISKSVSHPRRCAARRNQDATPTDLVPVLFNDLYGYIDKSTGVLLISPQFDEAEPFREGLALVGQDVVAGSVSTFWGFVNYLFCESVLFGCISRSGEVVIPLIYRSLGPFSEGLAPAWLSDRHGGPEEPCFGFLGKDGNWAIQPAFEEAKPFSRGWAKVVVHGRPAKVNAAGKVVVF